MTVTISPTELRRSLDELAALEQQQRAEAQREAIASAQHTRAQQDAERERTLDAIDLTPYDQARNDALDNLAAACRRFAAASQQREQAKVSAVETLRQYEHQTDRIRISGGNAALDRKLIVGEQKFEITELCRILEPLFRSINAPNERVTVNALSDRSRAGNRLPR